MTTPGVEPGAAASDLALVRLTAAGDQAALAALYDRYAGLVYSVALRVTRDAGPAQSARQTGLYVNFYLSGGLFFRF